MNDMFLVVFLPIVVVLLGAIFTVIERRASNCNHEYDQWQAWTTDHAYVQQTQCKKCKYILTHQERKLTDDRLDT